MQVLGGAHQLGALPRHCNGDMPAIACRCQRESFSLTLGAFLLAAALGVPDPIQRVVFATTVSVDVMLDMPPHAIDETGDELDAKWKAPDARTPSSGSSSMTFLCPWNGCNLASTTPFVKFSRAARNQFL